MSQAWNRIRGYRWDLVFLLANGIGLLLFFYKTLDGVARRRRVDWMAAFLEEMTASWAVFLLIPLVIWLVLERPVGDGGWRRRWPLYLLASVLFGLTHTSLIYGLRLITFAAAGRGVYDYGVLPVRYLMELPQQLMLFAGIVIVTSYGEHRRQAHDREVRLQAIERQLAEAQLEALQLQLRPHFLFNALNVISELVYEDARAADRMIGRLSELLRRVLRSDGRNEVPLREEVELLDLYLDVMRARFEDKLECTVEVDGDLESALVPQLVLQPVVENAMRHGADPVSGRIRVAVRARRRRDELLLEVEDSGRPTGPQSTNGHGVGLKNLAARLSRLYDEEGRLSIEHACTGTRVRISLPYHDDAGGAEA
ncbi:MAG TPA: histidine kinase [Thermoanaerobaculia bacterium]|nr:histidine kinase [Thermoanaerobaculia bacterium]